MREVSDEQATTYVSAEFKREAAALVLDQGYSHIDACRSLGVVDSALRRWVKQLEAERQGVTPKSKAFGKKGTGKRGQIYFSYSNFD